MEDFYKKLKSVELWQPPEEWLRIKTLDCHTAGEPLRIITSGLPELKGKTIIDRRRFMRENYDHLRTALMWEPRGHADQYGAVITPPVTSGAHFGVIFIHNEGYSTMCGHAIIAMTKVFIETGFIPANEGVNEIKIDAPAGLITSYAIVQNGKIEKVYFHNVPSFVLLADQYVEVKGLGKIKFDVAYGGAFYAFVKSEDAGVEMTPEGYREIIEKGMAIKHAVMNNFVIEHPFENDLSFLYGTIFYGPPLGDIADSRNVCVFAEGEVDRSPTGTGVSARMALHYSRGELALNKPYMIESILGTTFIGKAVREEEFGKHKAVIPQVEGNAYISGSNEFFIDPGDSLKKGFFLR